MRRLVVLLTVAAVMAAMMAFSAGPAAAAIGEPQLQMEEDGMWDFGSGDTSVEWSYYNGYYGKTTYNSSGYPQLSAVAEAQKRSVRNNRVVSAAIAQSLW